MAIDFLQDAIDVFFADFAETIQYLKRDGSDPRDVDAIVDRNPPSVLPEVPSQLTDTMVIAVKNTATRGVISTELDKGGDSFLIAARIGKDPKKHSIVNVIRQDAGVIVLEVR
jgi:hypothetical protein